MSKLKRPNVGQVWQHRNKNTYEVILLSNVDSEREKYPPMVSYQNIDNDKIYTRKLSDWHRSMTWVGIRGFSYNG